MTRKTRYTDIHKCVCEECGTVMFVPRSHSHFRTDGHKKHLYCPVCKKRTAHVERYDYNTRWNGDSLTK